MRRTPARMAVVMALTRTRTGTHPVPGLYASCSSMLASTSKASATPCLTGGRASSPPMRVPSFANKRCQSTSAKSASSPARQPQLGKAVSRPVEATKSSSERYLDRRANWQRRMKEMLGAISGNGEPSGSTDSKNTQTVGAADLKRPPSKDPGLRKSKGRRKKRERREKRAKRRLAQAHLEKGPDKKDSDALGGIVESIKDTDKFSSPGSEMDKDKSLKNVKAGPSFQRSSSTTPLSRDSKETDRTRTRGRSLRASKGVLNRLEEQRKSWSWYGTAPENSSKGKTQDESKGTNDVNTNKALTSGDDHASTSNGAKDTKYLWPDLNVTTKEQGEPQVHHPAEMHQAPNRNTTMIFSEDEEILKRRKMLPRNSELEENTEAQDFDKIYYEQWDKIPAPDSAAYSLWQSEKLWSSSIGGKLAPQDVQLQNVDPLREMEVPILAHGIDRVLFNPGVHWLRDTRTGIYNFDPYVRNLYDVDLFDYSALSPYQTSSVDTELAEMTKKHAKRYSGSTSSLTALLSQIYFCISAWRQPPMTGFSEGFQKMPKEFSFSAKLPANVVLRRFEDEKDDASGSNEASIRYAVDSDKAAGKEPENANYVLTQLGKSLEKLLTSSAEEYERFLRVNSHTLSEEERGQRDAYHYSTTDKFMLRSQLDCADDRLPRRTFDLKTRAVVAVRMDRANWVESSGYTLRRNTGVNESFERELWDMSRGTMLKYFFQARIGDMDGILVAYHSTSTIFGFQYFSREDMAERLFGSVEMGEQAFRLCIGLLEKIFDAATMYFPNDTLRFTMDAQSSSMRRDPVLNVFVRPVTSEDIEVAAPNDQDRSCLLLENPIDRYLSDALVVGPVDFGVPKGYGVDATTEDEITRRERAQLPSLTWTIEYSIKPRTDLSSAETQLMLDNLISRQAGLLPLAMPNVEALNERERMRQSALSKNPTAWAKFLDDRRTGVAAGMPVAPGQITFDDESTVEAQVEDGEGNASARVIQDEAQLLEEDADVAEQHNITGESGSEIEGVDAELLADAAETSDQRGVPPHMQKVKVHWKPSGVKLQRLRMLAQLGQQDKDELSKTDRLEEYKRRE